MKVLKLRNIQPHRVLGNSNVGVFQGVLEAVAENLVLEVDAFGVDCAPEHREIRKLIASALTNLTFGNAQSKRRLCAYPNLIEYVIRVIDDSHKLAQVTSLSISLRP